MDARTIRPMAFVLPWLILVLLQQFLNPPKLYAGFVLITSPAGLNATGAFRLNDLGPENTPVDWVYELTANSGEKAIFSQSAGQALRVNEDSSWDGNYLPGEALVWTRYGGPLVVDFGTTKLKTFGLQIQPDIFGDFGAYISVLDQAGSELVRYELTGVSTDVPDGSALFIGVGSDDSTTDFSKIQVGLTSGGNLNNFAYNSPLFQAVPEPATCVLAGIGSFFIVYLYHTGKKRGPRTSRLKYHHHLNHSFVSNPQVEEQNVSNKLS